jgi:hypothetical protein
MLNRKKALCAWLVIGATGIVTASCSSNNSSGNGNGDSSPAKLVSECDQICNNVVAQCAGAASASCLSACNDLNLVPMSCLNPFLSYLVCITGATSITVTCGANGNATLVPPPDCESDRQATLNCNASPGLVAACIALPGNTSCAAAPAGGGPNPEFCVGAPTGCAPPSPNPLGIGIYCCP